MKDLGKTKFYIGMQIEHFPNRVLVHRSTYIKKILKHFYMDKTHPLTSPIVVWSLDVKKEPFRPCKKCEELLGREVPYISAIGALIYLANCTFLNINIALFMYWRQFSYINFHKFSLLQKIKLMTLHLLTLVISAII